jgi:thiosulfate/3-mercaptopyruvate sulfurtransferase
MTTTETDHISDLPPGPLVSAAWLEAHLGTPGLRIVDVRGEVGGNPPAKRSDYERAHIPGAVFTDWTADFVDGDDHLPGQLAPPDRFRAAAESLGIGDGDVVVTYDDYFNIFAGRLWWALRANGHRAVRVLDGGWQSWRAERRPTTPSQAPISPARFTPRPVPDLCCNLEEVESAMARGAMLVDARPRHLYDGDTEAPRTGHIPGAVNVPYTELVDHDSGLFASPEELREVLAGAGIDPEDGGRDVISSCGSGVSASVVCMALDLLGRPEVPVFDGSFAEWVADPERPVAQRPAEGAR